MLGTRMPARPRRPIPVRIGLMSSWFDKLLEDLQRRQAEQDARREGRPFGGPRPTNGGGNGAPDGGPGDGDEPPIRPGRPRVLTPDGRSPQPRWGLLIGIGLAAFILFGVLGGLVELITDLMWYSALGRTNVLTTRIW